MIFTLIDLYLGSLYFVDFVMGSYVVQALLVAPATETPHIQMVTKTTTHTNWHRGPSTKKSVIFYSHFFILLATGLLVTGSTHTLQRRPRRYVWGLGACSAVARCVYRSESS